MKKTLAAVLLMLSCSLIQERLAVKECKFSLKQARPYEFTLSNLKLDLTIGIANPNKVDAVLDRFDYQLVIGGENVLSGATSQRVKVLAGKTKDFLTTVTINYQSISTAILKALKEGNPTYEMKGRVYIDTPIGNINYPVTINL